MQIFQKKPIFIPKNLSRNNTPEYISIPKIQLGNKGLLDPHPKKQKDHHLRKKAQSYHYQPKFQDIPSIVNYKHPSDGAETILSRNQSIFQNAYKDNNENIMNFLLKKGRQIQEITKRKNEEEIINKQVELIKKLLEIRENNRKKKEELYNEKLRHKISSIESMFIFKKFEKDQMAFLLEIKEGLIFIR